MSHIPTPKAAAVKVKKFVTQYKTPILIGTAIGSFAAARHTARKLSETEGELAGATALYTTMNRFLINEGMMDKYTDTYWKKI